MSKLPESWKASKRADRKAFASYNAFRRMMSMLYAAAVEWEGENIVKTNSGHEFSDNNPHYQLYKEISDPLYKKMYDHMSSNRRFYCAQARDLTRSRRELRERDYDIDDDRSIGDYEINGPDRPTPEY